MTQVNSPLVVVGVDGGRSEPGALRYAAEEARRTGSELRLVHVTPTWPPASLLPMEPALSNEELARAGEEILERARTQVAGMAPDVVLTTARLTGPRIATLVDASDGARLLVVGRETHSGLERMLGAGTTAAVATHAHVPVAVVPTHWAPAVTAGPIVVGLKSRAHAAELLGAAFREAATRQAPIDVLHAWKLPDQYADRIEARSHRDDRVAEGTALVEELLTPWRRDHPEVAVSVEVVHDHPAHALVAAAERARLLMLVRRPPLPVLGEHLGGTARAVIRPVEVVPGAEVVQELPGLELEQSGALLR